MKKTLISILIITTVLLIIIVTSIIENSKELQAIKKFNSTYEQYLNKEIYGTDVATIINKAINSNLKNEIQQDENKNFILNDTNSLQVEVEFLYNEQTGETRTFNMEKIYYRGMKEFIQPFSLTKFKLITIEYHTKTKLVSKLLFKQLEA